MCVFIYRWMDIVDGKNKSNMFHLLFKNSEYDQEIPQSQTADKLVVSRGGATQQSWDIRKIRKIEQPTHLSNQDDCKTRMNIK